MSYKDDNLNELFQKAAEDYPLKTGNADWDKFAAIWNAAIKQKTSSKTKLLRYALLLLLLGGATILGYKYLPVNTKQQKLTNRSNAPLTASESRYQNETAKIKIDNTPAALAVTGNEAVSKADRPFNQNQLLLKNQAPYSMQNNSLQNSNLNATTNLLQLSNENSAQKQNAENNIAKKQPELTAKLKSNLNAADEQTNYRQRQNSIELNQIYRLYGMLYAGPEFSTVKFQHVVKPGYKIGIGIGYRINNKLSIELGLQREHLNFYTDGRYIDTGMLRIKGNTAIKTVDANSKLTSVPVTLKYNFGSKNSGHFFAAAGVNAIIITHKEEYKYAVSKNGVPTNLSKNYASLSAPKYFTGVNISAGYVTKVAGLWNVKVEPYYQAPVHNLGVGKLPVSNFGVDIGIIKDLK